MAAAARRAIIGGDWNSICCCCSICSRASAAAAAPGAPGVCAKP
jgi:hypothetical protein